MHNDLLVALAKKKEESYLRLASRVFVHVDLDQRLHTGLPRHTVLIFLKKIPGFRGCCARIPERLCWWQRKHALTPHEGLSHQCYSLTITNISSPCRCEAVIGDSSLAAVPSGCLVEASSTEPSGSSKSALGASIIVTQAKAAWPRRLQDLSRVRREAKNEE